MVFLISEPFHTETMSHRDMLFASGCEWQTWVSKWCAISLALEAMSAPEETVMTLQDTPSSVSRMKPSSIAPIHCFDPTNERGLSPADSQPASRITMQMTQTIGPGTLL